ncbi:succinylglutamate desuccinylase/aspartoacylase family protein [Gayadomonas joobiniege]|uniref:succinylglutamate desuccinylase/aspartoacylase family protein n=1 Tax=Gayadomonas joobiniege TaxID=1234606 RepID=UPI000381491D|nr:succinylglutamate desuccinylase/aspartoacylase family protein [Gayadomonas joobiniege]
MKDIVIAGVSVKPGEQKTIDIPAARLYTDLEAFVEVKVIRGRRPGPCVFISAAIHGDELNGIEIARRLLKSRSINALKGTLIVVPILNVLGVLNQSRYLPDRRDLNRSFPGSAKGSLAGRLAHLFLQQIVCHCDYGIDLHTGAIHRSNLPQIRADLADEKTMELAKSFGVPVLLNADIRDGSLRESAGHMGCRVLLYEAGEALRFDELSIRAGVAGILNVMAALGMIRKSSRRKALEPYIAKSSRWVRAVSSGIVRERVGLGDMVEKNQLIAEIGNPMGNEVVPLHAPFAGIVIGKSNIPLVHEGEAMYHIAAFSKINDVGDEVEMLADTYLPSNNI